MNIRVIGLTGILTICLVLSCEKSPEDYQEQAANPEIFRATVKTLSDIIVHDIFSPPVASRVYAYPSIAAYEVMAYSDPDYQSLAGQLTDLTPPPVPDNQNINFPLASVQAFIKVGTALVFSEDRMRGYAEGVYQQYSQIGMPEKVIKASLDYGNRVGQHILNWADGDNYKQTRTFPKYTINDQPYRWQPTPPNYMDGIEPHWNKIRTFVIDSANQFIPVPPTPFDMEKGSKFYQEVMEVYDVGNGLDEEQLEIAKFWDCNPYVSHTQGHVMFATKKITPGGHWIGITNIATRNAKADFMQTVEAYTLVSISLFDGFISCWDEKYRSELIRPETVINKYIDENWAPVLQTPPFPEYTSGHSVISAAAATALTSLFGDPFSFEDTTELEFGLPPRSFKSFYEASNEAAISRLYGGIHYLPACENGIIQGKALGNFVVSNIQTQISG